MPGWLKSALHHIPEGLEFQLRMSEQRAASSRSRIAVAGGYGSHGELVHCERNSSGKIRELWLAATRLVPEATLAAEMMARYDRRRAASPKLPGREPARRPD